MNRKMMTAFERITRYSMRRRLITALMLLLGVIGSAQDHRPGEPELLTLHSTIFANSRTIRVWLPPQYHDPSQRGRKYPVFYFTDGIAAFHGRKLDVIAGRLIRSGKIAPTIFAGIDNGGSTLESKNPGSDRANEYLPYPDDSLAPPVPNPEGKRFPEFLEKEVRPLVERLYRTSNDICIAGASYGGEIALFTIMERPGNYRWLLLESPSLYVGNDALLHRAETFRDWPKRVYVGAGTDEGDGDSKREMVDDATRFVNSIGSSTTTCLVVVLGAQHNEDAWRQRLPAALEFLPGGRSCPQPAPKASGSTPNASSLPNRD